MKTTKQLPMKTTKQLLLSFTEEEFIYIETLYVKYRSKEVNEGKEPGSKQKMIMDILKMAGTK